MEIRKTNKSIHHSNGVSYLSGYNVRLTKSEFDNLVNHLVATKKKAKEEVNTWIRDNLTSNIKYGYNCIGITTFGIIEEYLVEKLSDRYKSSGNRYFNFIITDLKNGFNKLSKYKGLEVGQEVITKKAKKFNDQEVKRGQSFIIVDFPKTIHNSRIVRAITKYGSDNTLYSFLHTELTNL